MKQIITVLIAAGACLAMASAAHANPGLMGLYATYSWQEYPDLEMQSQAETTAAMFPDYAPGVLADTQYAEHELTSRQLTAMVTCSSRVDGRLAVIHYSRDGFSRLILSGLPLVADDVTTVTFSLPQGCTEGLTRVLLWHGAVETDWLGLLACYPNWTAEPVPGVLGQQWFERGGKQAGYAPWVNPFRPAFDPPLYTSSFSWPWCLAMPTVSGTVQSKDCSIYYTGRSDMAFDESGAYGRWVLDWSADLELVFAVPPGMYISNAELVVYGEQDPLYQRITPPQLEVSVNDWLLDDLVSQTTAGSGVQPYCVEVSHYLREGINRITVGVNSMAGDEVLVDGIELWVY